MHKSGTTISQFIVVPLPLNHCRSNGYAFRIRPTLSIRPNPAELAGQVDSRPLPSYRLLFRSQKKEWYGV